MRFAHSLAFVRAILAAESSRRVLWPGRFLALRLLRRRALELVFLHVVAFVFWFYVLESRLAQVLATLGPPPGGGGGDVNSDEAKSAPKGSLQHNAKQNRDYIRRRARQIPFADSLCLAEAYNPCPMGRFVG